MGPTRHQPLCIEPNYDQMQMPHHHLPDWWA